MPLQLLALPRQEFEGSWEVIVADNGSTDDLDAVISAWSPELPHLVRVDAGACPGDAFARNVGVMHAQADRIAMCDADDVVAPEWLSAVDQALADAGIVTGPLARVPASSLERDSPFAMEDRTPKGVGDLAALAQLFLTSRFTEAPNTFHAVPTASGCNFGFWREALPQGFAADYLLGSDHATSLRALLHGVSVGWAPRARILYAQSERVPLHRIRRRKCLPGA